ncbi:MAG: DUF4870 domain-containing protein [Fimbriimonadales bacterium]
MSYPQDGPLTDEERLWGMLAHLLTLLGYVIAIGQYVVPLVIYLAYKDRSRFVAFHALQALYFQLILLVGSILLAVVGFFIVIITCGVGAILVFLLGVAYTIVALVYTIWPAIEASRGAWFELPLAGGWARATLGI